MKSDFLIAVTQLAAERNLPQDMVVSAVEAALASAYRKDGASGAQSNIRVHLDPNTGEVEVFQIRTVVEEVTNDLAEVTLAEAKKIRKGQTFAIGDMIEEQLSAHAAGRIAAQTAKQVVFQRLREAERELVYAEFAEKSGEVYTATVQRGFGRRDNDGPQRPGVGRAAPERAVAARALPPRHEDEGHHHGGHAHAARAGDHRLPDTPGPSQAAVRDGGAGDLQRHRGDTRHRARARLAFQSRGLRAAGRRRPGRRVRRPARHPHPEHRQRAAGREDRRHPVVARPVGLHLARAQPRTAAARRLERGRAGGGHRGAGQAGCRSPSDARGRTPASRRS